MPSEEDIIASYRQTQSIRVTARQYNISAQSIRRILIQAGEYSTPTSSYISGRLDRGESIAQIAKDLGRSPNAVQSYAPYNRGAYCVGEKSENALKIKKYREKGKTN
ncbi:hypothetical protein [Flavonifractor plautii]|uniref:Uncharacterized protein n=1 Tax=Flavonifractor plautii 1_3_50AFAA TaxID=742738 RepID=A0A096CCI5_FLAPL|nr:hypothetical protein [Flavonifractor plautii]KGF52632.1 hypothetical protein HMPREF9460_03970 [Flavonifractor plautii 1_3_50AFAA]MCI7153192.1 hypothetical protein [Flavonifractor plautii]MDY3701209.1 hypothetical protein [Flavonifractor plautii]